MLQFDCNDYGSQIVEKPCHRVVLATHGVLDFSNPRALSQAWQCIMRFSGRKPQHAHREGGKPQLLPLHVREMPPRIRCNSFAIGGPGSFRQPPQKLVQAMRPPVGRSQQHGQGFPCRCLLLHESCSGFERGLLGGVVGDRGFP